MPATKVQNGFGLEGHDIFLPMNTILYTKPKYLCPLLIVTQKWPYIRGKLLGQFWSQLWKQFGGQF